MDSDRVFFLTGAASGIGKHLAGALAARGHRVFATDLNEKGLSDLGAASSRIVTHPLDVTRTASWEEAMDAAEKALGPADVVMNIAGVIKPGYVHELDDRAIDFHIDINVKGVILGTRAAARRMVARGAGHIVNF